MVACHRLVTCDGMTFTWPGTRTLVTGGSGFLGRVVASVPSKVALGLRLAVWIVALAPLFVLGRVATITSLAPSDRERVVAALVTSRNYALRSLVMILKTMGALLYAADDSVRERLKKPAFVPATVPLRRKPVHAA